MDGENKFFWNREGLNGRDSIATRSESVAYFLGNENLPITDTLLASWLAVILLILFAYILKGRLKMVPGRLQAAVEFILAFVISQIEAMMPDSGRKFLPFIRDNLYVCRDEYQY